MLRLIPLVELTPRMLQIAIFKKFRTEYLILEVATDNCDPECFDFNFLGIRQFAYEKWVFGL